MKRCVAEELRMLEVYFLGKKVFFWSLLVIGTFLDVSAVNGNHYRGGTISWRPGPNFTEANREIIFTSRLSWSNSHVGCDDATVTSQGIIGDADQQWSCTFGCIGPVGPIRGRCSEFSEAGDWAVSQNSFSHVFATDGPFDVSYMHCCWLDTELTNASSEWALTTTLLLGRRSDTGRPNNAPVVTSPLTFQLNNSEPTVISIDVTDADNDIVTCRLGLHFGECGDVCDLHPDFSIDEASCRITYHASPQMFGLFPFSVIVEDHHNGPDDVTIGEQTVRQSRAISSVPYQFVIDLGKAPDDAGPTTCSGVLPLVEVATNQNHVTIIKATQMFELKASATTCDDTNRIETFGVASGPATTSFLTSSTTDVTIDHNGKARLSFKWKPKVGQEGRHRFCLSASQTDGLISTDQCVDVIVEEMTEMCVGSGLTRIVTFDSEVVSFTGGCRYQLATTTFDPALRPALQPFNISISNDGHVGIDGRQRIGFVRVVVANKRIEVHRNKRIVVDGARVLAPIRYNGVSVDLSGRFVVVSGESGLRMRFDGQATFVVGLPLKYMDQVRGLCGNFNGDSGDDFMTSNEIFQATSSAVLAASFALDPSSCLQPPARDELPCRPGPFNHVVCSFLTKENGCFGDCHRVIDPTPYFTNCMNAMCNNVYSEELLNELIGSYADACQMEGATICDWRTQIRSGLECPPFSKYNSCSPSVPRTCSNLDATALQDEPCTEGCQCSEGYVLSSDSCVPQEQCGCFIQGSYRLPGFTYRTNDCAHRCQCLGQNRTSCSPVPLCGPLETCAPHTDGFMRCSGRMQAPATCKVIGDPHYQTFDGAAYDSMSTCAHVLVKSRDDAIVTPFTVIGINDQPRVNNTVSHVKEVHITVGGSLGFNVSLTEGPVIKLDGAVVFPGSSFPGVRFRKTTNFLVATFDFGLVVRWDGVDRLRLSAWSPLFRQVEGLCGNYDGDVTNEFTARNGGGLVTDVGRFVNSWRVSGLDIDGNSYPEPELSPTQRCLSEGFSGESLQACIALLPRLPEALNQCRERRSGSIAPPCSSASRLESHRSDCAILTDPDGPFAPCHAEFDPQVVFRACVFDLCAFEGNGTFRERIIQSYDYDCRERQIVPSDWRRDSDSPIECSGDNSVFSSCMSECQPSCSDLTAEDCRRDLDMGSHCVEGCQCLDGFVSSDGVCVSRESCGCVIQGRYQLTGFTFRRSNCTQQCECVGEGEVECTDIEPCKIGLLCEDDANGYERCIGRLRRRATCTAVTDPHYKTFDGTRYDLMGTCAYVMTQNKAGSSAPDFRVVAVNENPLPGQIVSHVREAHVTFTRDNATHVVRFGPGSEVRLDGVEILPGTELLGLLVRRAGDFLVVEFDFRLVVKWNGIDRLRITAWQPLRNQVEGLCGDFDDVMSNDLITSYGVLTDNIPTFVRSWEVSGFEGTENCVLPPPRTADDVCATEESIVRFGELCSGLTNPLGSFRPCHDSVDPVPVFSNCLYDLCVYNGSNEIRMQIFSSYAQDCLSAGSQPSDDWMAENGFIPVECGANEHYNSSGSECQPTCVDRDASACVANNDVGDRTGGCECDAGFVQSGMGCVTMEECGCLVDGMYHAAGFVHRSGDCSVECTCHGLNNVTCVNVTECPRRYKCATDRDGYERCVRKTRRRASCMAVTDPHYLTFDGTRFDSMGLCSYIMVRSKSNATVPFFQVVAVNEQPVPHRIVSHVKEVFVQFGGNMTMHFAAGPVIQLNGVTVNPGYSRGGVEVRVGGRFHVVDWEELGLVVRWDGEDRLRISAWSRLRYQVEGVCGDFNDNMDDDLTTPSGDLLPFNETDAFVNSWIISGFGAEGCPDVPLQDATPPCTQDHELAPHIPACSPLTDRSGPFRACMDLVDPQAAFRACLFDQCSYGGDVNQKDRLMASYLETCLDEDDDVIDNVTQLMIPPVWRPAANISEFDCPPNSHYTTCMPQCQPTCDDINATACRRNPRLGRACMEGCEADPGFVLSGDDFVTIAKCGCKLNGEYYKDGQTFYTENCAKKCSCGQALLQCAATQCPNDRECRANKDGQLECLNLRTKTCEVLGNGFFTTFDQRDFEFLGVCSFALVRHRAGSMVTVETERVGNVTGVKSVNVTFEPFDSTVKLTRVGDVVEIEVDGVGFNHTFQAANSTHRLSVRRNSRFVIVATQLGPRLEFDGVLLRVSLPTSYKDAVFGLCGNFNGNPDDDVTRVNGSENIEAFAASHSTRDCDTTTSQPLFTCGDDDLEMWKGGRYCGVISNFTGSLRACNRVLPPHITRNYLQRCAVDVCLSGGSLKTLERAIQSYTHECLSSGVRICDWRESTGWEIPTSCPLNSHYEGCALTCPLTCGEVPSTDDCPIAEGCACDDGFVFDNDACVTVGSCQCIANNRTYNYGDSFTTRDCTRNCTCYGQGSVICRDLSPCILTETCASTRDGDYSCVRSPRNRSRCEISSGVHYRTFDGLSFDAVSACSYMLLRSTNGASPSFSVIVRSNTTMTSSPMTSRIDKISVMFGDGDHYLSLGDDIELDGRQVAPGADLSGVRITRVGRSLAAAFGFGLVLRWDGGSSLLVEALPGLKGNVEGLCGNFDDVTANDVTMPDGRTSDSVELFFESWKVPGHDGVRCSGPPPAVSGPPCTDPATLASSRQGCRVIIDPLGLFSPCHPYLDPRQSYEDCVYDACADAFLDQAMTSYVRECLALGGPPVAWRNSTNRVLECPLYSEYRPCVEQCQPSCVDRDAARCRNISELGATCVEGCVCDPGFYGDGGGRCVPESECGCLTRSQTFLAPQSSAFLPGCTMRCECNGGQLVCDVTQCNVDEECSWRGGEYGCHFADECEYSNGGCSHSCETVDDVMRCSCPPGMTLADDARSCEQNPVGLSAQCSDGRTEEDLAAGGRTRARQELVSKLQNYLTLATTDDPDSTASVCGSRWTRWLDRDDPGGDGDDETLPRLRREFPHLLCPNPVAMETRLSDGRSSTVSGNYVTMSLKEGLLCNNEDQIEGKRCEDFQVRFLCLDNLF